MAAQPSILALQRLRQKEHCRFEANLDYTVSSRLAWATYIARSDFLKNKLDVVPHAFSQCSTQYEEEESGSRPDSTIRPCLKTKAKVEGEEACVLSQNPRQKRTNDCLGCFPEVLSNSCPSDVGRHVWDKGQGG